ncbi:DUF6049 family protein [Microbacterium sp. P04]|uniref:DUF6049 family protein n=1 Tax=Microbacterium sp. P04 TaxID=3366947 RepID=UPI0037463C6C
MTVTPFEPRAGARAPRRLWWRRLAATGAALALLWAPVSPAVGAATPDPTATASAGVTSLTLVPSAGGVVRPGQDLAVTVTLDNETAGASDSTVAVALGDSALPDRAALTAWIGGDGGGVALREVGTAALGAAPAGARSTASVQVPAADPALAGRAPGVYPLRATATVDGVALTSTSVLIVPDDAAPAVAVATVVPITAPAITQGLLTAEELTTLTASDGSLTAQLDAVENTAAILAVDPAIAAAIRVLGDTAPASAQAWLQRLLELPNPRFALQFGDADLATQVQAGLTQPLAPTSLAAYVPTGTVVSTPTADPTATPGTAAADGAAQDATADIAALTDIGSARANVYWPIGGTASAGVVAALGALGTPEQPALTLVPSASTSVGADGSRVGARVDAAASALVTYDSTVSDLLRAAADETDTARRDAKLAAVTAYLDIEQAGAPLVVTVDRGTGRSGAALKAALAAVSGAPGVVPAGLSAVAGSTAVAADVSDVTADATRVTDLTSLLADEGDIARFATVLDDPGLLTGRERAEVLQLFGSPWRADAAAAQAAIAAHRAATVALYDAIGIRATGPNLVSYTSTYAPYVRNDLPWPITVTLIARPDDPRLIIQTRTIARAQPASNTRVEVPIEAQIANGQVTVAMQLYSPSGEPIGAPQSVDVEVHAEWETIGIVILGVLLALFLGLGIVRTVLRRRATKRDVAPAADDA